MARKQKNEAAFLAIIAAIVPNTMTGRTSQEDQTASRDLPMYSAEHIGGPESPLGSGVYRDRVMVRIRSSADRQRTQDAGVVKAAHAANVTAVLEALLKNQISGKMDLRDMAARLSAAVSDYHCFGVMNRGQVEVGPEKRTFVDAFLFEVVNGETDCT